ncbi:MAG: hypothetical protein ACOY4I_01625 [Bacillota bacterium]
MDLIGLICLLTLFAVILPSGCASWEQKLQGLTGEVIKAQCPESFRAPQDETLFDLAAVSVAAR